VTHLIHIFVVGHLLYGFKTCKSSLSLLADAVPLLIQIKKAVAPNFDKDAFGLIGMETGAP